MPLTDLPTSAAPATTAQTPFQASMAASGSTTQNRGLSGIKSIVAAQRTAQANKVPQPTLAVRQAVTPGNTPVGVTQADYDAINGEYNNWNQSQLRAGLTPAQIAQTPGYSYFINKLTDLASKTTDPTLIQTNIDAAMSRTGDPVHGVSAQALLTAFQKQALSLGLPTNGTTADPPPAPYVQGQGGLDAGHGAYTAARFGDAGATAAPAATPAASTQAGSPLDAVKSGLNQQVKTQGGLNAQQQAHMQQTFPQLMQYTGQKQSSGIASHPANAPDSASSMNMTPSAPQPSAQGGATGGYAGTAQPTPMIAIHMHGSNAPTAPTGPAPAADPGTPEKAMTAAPNQSPSAPMPGMQDIGSPLNSVKSTNPQPL